MPPFKEARLGEPTACQVPRRYAVTDAPDQPCEGLDEVKPSNQHAESEALRERLGVERLLRSGHSGLNKRPRDRERKIGVISSSCVQARPSAANPPMQPRGQTTRASEEVRQGYRETALNESRP